MHSYFSYILLYFSHHYLVIICFQTQMVHGGGPGIASGADIIIPVLEETQEQEDVFENGQHSHPVSVEKFEM